MTWGRYWPGKAPDWAEEQQRSDSEEASDDEDVAAAAIAPPVIVRASEDPRLRRLAEVCAHALPSWQEKVPVACQMCLIRLRRAAAAAAPRRGQR